MTKTPTLSCGRAVVSDLEGSLPNIAVGLDPILESYSLSNTELDVLLNQPQLQSNSAEFCFLKKAVELQKEYCGGLLLLIQYKQSGLMQYCLQCRENQRLLLTFPFGVKSDHSLMNPQHEETNPFLWPMP